MFKRLAVLLTVLVVTGCATTPHPDYSFTKVLDVPKFEKTEIFDRSEEWVALTFNSAQSVIQVKNRESGRIIGRGVLSVQKRKMSPVETFNFTMIIDAKDGKSKIKFMNFTNTELYEAPSMDITGKIERLCTSMAYDLEAHIENLAVDTASW